MFSGAYLYDLHVCRNKIRCMLNVIWAALLVNEPLRSDCPKRAVTALSMTVLVPWISRPQLTQSECSLCMISFHVRDAILDVHESESLGKFTLDYRCFLTKFPRGGSLAAIFRYKGERVDSSAILSEDKSWSKCVQDHIAPSYCLPG